MIARGDMGVEIPFEEIPAIQKEIIKKGYRAGKPVITATQMLESMINSPRPTRAEITDVANAIYDGTSAIMLSGETAAGNFPVEAVRTMAKIAETTESRINYASRLSKMGAFRSNDVTNAISHAAVTTALDLGASTIITVTKSGYTAQMLSKFRSPCDILSLTPDKRICRQTNLSWGVTPALIKEMSSTDELIEEALRIAKELNHVKTGDTVVITAGVHIGVPGNTNLLEVITVS